ncbi:unnamed protein product [Arabis nemorensis]|uniref:TF-B3 domain-containing protein n=1 Tax=Arabis nemorensis TaxID=586526 RepID=A0A565BFV9_9BRAS|nr:unnamed protein product [Arabis nemorensis]
MAHLQHLHLKLGLGPHDPWVIKKWLSDSDVHGQFVLPKHDFETFIIPVLPQVLVENLANGVEVKIHIIEEGHEAADHILTLIIYKGMYVFKGGWSVLAREKGYKKDDEIGLMWDKWSSRFFLHHITRF